MRIFLREILETLILALFIFLVLQFSVKNYRVQGNSMYPGFEPGQYLFVNAVAYSRFDVSKLGDFGEVLDTQLGEKYSFVFGPPSYGDLVVFESPVDQKNLIKRVVCELHGGESKFTQKIKNPQYKPKYDHIISVLKKENLYNNWFIDWE